jgi:hypothetical protein
MSVKYRGKIYTGHEQVVAHIFLAVYRSGSSKI